MKVYFVEIHLKWRLMIKTFFIYTTPEVKFSEFKVLDGII